MHCSFPPHLGVNPSFPHSGSNQPAAFQPRLQLAKLIRPLVARKAVVASCKADTPHRTCQRSAGQLGVLQHAKVQLRGARRCDERVKGSAEDKEKVERGAGRGKEGGRE